MKKDIALVVYKIKTRPGSKVFDSEKANLGFYYLVFKDSNSNFGHTNFKVWRSLHACHSEGATYRNHRSLMVEKKMFFQ
jgi:hypothetical protein